MFDDARLKELYAEAFGSNRWGADWRRQYEAFLQRIRGMTDQELATPDAQELLWSAKDITPVGPGEGVNLGDATRDAEVVSAIVGLRNQQWPADRIARSTAVQAEFNRIQELVTRNLPRSPTARLWRLFAVLLPEDMLCIVSWQPCLTVMKEVLPSVRGLYGVEAHVLIRARFREVLGAEKDLAEHVRRSTFSWFLYEKLTGQGASDQEGAQPKPDTSTLKVWPFQAQNKGLPSPNRNVARYRDVVRAADGGARIEEIVATLAAEAEYEGMGKDSIRQIIGGVKKVGLIESRDGELHPTEDGEQFLRSKDPDPLVIRMIERIFPIAHLLKMFAERERSRTEAVEDLQKLYPRWGTGFQPGQMVRWLEGLGLVAKTGTDLELTDYGRYWVGRLPDPLPVATPEIEAPDEEDDVPDQKAQVAPAAAQRKWPGLAELLSAFDRYREEHRLVLDRGQFVALHNALHCSDRKRFVILTGLSGTGKTLVMQVYSELFCRALGLDVERHREVIAVSPDWRDPSGLLGYVNELREDPVYQPGPALNLLLEANRHPHLPYFLLLDEMNLARVELYFAPFLSAMERGGKITLHTRAPSEVSVPPTIPWPTNLFIMGSVNMDETTHPFSDKVLDRAFTLEFWDVDLATFFKRQEGHDPEAAEILTQIHEILRRVRRHFGYRTAGEVLGFARLAPDAAASGVEQNTLLDQAIFSKVLPRVRGENTQTMQDALSDLRKFLDSKQLRQSARKVAEMAEMLSHSGVTRFWG